MPTRLIVHLGANKTGSSAIQKFLSLNCEALREQGLIVPSHDFTFARRVAGSHVFAFEELFRNPQGRQQLESAIEVLADSQADVKAILLSAENLAANPAAPHLFAGLVDRFDVRVILYVRRQDEYILSTWQQWHSKIGDDFWAWAISAVGQLGNWRNYIEQWETVVPRERITVRVFERAKLDGGDVILDYYNQLGLETPIGELQYPGTRVNPSFSDAITEMVMGNKLIFDNAHDNDFYNFVLETTGDRYVKNNRQSSITFEQRKAILGKYASSNRWVKEAYLSKEAGLFSAPKEGDYDHASAEALQNQKFEFLTTMLYRLHKKGSP